MIAAFLLLVAPASLCLASSVLMQAAVPDDRLRRLPDAAALLALAVCTPALAMLVLYGPGTSPVLGVAEIGISARLDSVSLAMTALTAFLGWVLLRFSATHLRDSGVARASSAWLCATLGGLLLLATAGHLPQMVLGFVLTGLGVTRLLSLFTARTALTRAAGKHRLIARAADAALIAGAACAVVGYGTSEIGAILEAGRAGDIPVIAQIAAWFIALAAMLRAALIPAHVWLREADGAPLPVAALVQSLVVGAGVFVAVRMADLLLGAPMALAMVAAAGGATALVAGFVAATQASGRGAQTWSTIAHSGFAMLLCGLGLFPLALLHLASHALHRTHALLGREAPIAQAPTTESMALPMTSALAIYAVVACVGWLLGVAPQVLAVGAILTLGMACAAAQASEPWAAARVAATFAPAFLAVQWLAFALTTDALPAVPAATPIDWALMLMTFTGFALAALFHSELRARSNHPLLRGLRVHVANGFYLDALADRWLRTRRMTSLTKET